MVMTITEFGQTIKQKYPSYQNMPDDVVGNMVIQKYPQYQSLVTGYTKSLQQQQEEQTLQNSQITNKRNQLGLNEEQAAQRPFNFTNTVPTPTSSQSNQSSGTIKLSDIMNGSKSSIEPTSNQINTTPTNYNEYKTAMSQINAMRDADHNADTSSGGAHYKQIEDHYDNMIKTLDPNGVFADAAKQESDYNIKRQQDKKPVKSLLDSLDYLKEQGKNVNISNANPIGKLFDPSAGNFDQSKKLIGQTVAKLFESGKLSDQDRKFYQDQITNIDPVLDPQWQSKIDNLKINLIRSQGYDPEDFGIKNGKKDTENKNQSGNYVNDYLIPNAKEVANGFLNIPKNIIDYEKDKLSKGDINAAANPNDLLLNGLTTIGKGIINSANEDLGRPLEGGDVAGRIIQHAHDKPVSTLLDAATVAFPAAKAAMAGKAGVAAKTAEGAADAATDATITTAKNAKGVSPINITSPNIVQNVIRNISDVVSGGGSKPYIKREAVSDSTLPQNQVLNDEGILLHPTETGRIRATSQAMDRIGKNLEAQYESQKTPIKASDINKKLDSELSKMGYSPENIEYMKNYINTQGNIDITNLDTSIPQVDLWRLARNLQDYPPKMLHNPMAAGEYQNFSLNTAKILRKILEEKNTNLNPLNSRYSALADYYKNVLQDPTGIKSKGGIDKMITGAVSGMTNPVLNTAYKFAGLGNKKTVIPFPESSPEVSQPSAGLKSSIPRPVSTTVKGTATPLEGVKDVLKDMYPSIKADMRYKQGNFHPKGKVPQPKSASVKMFITNDDVRQLSDLGYSKSDINKMKPQEAQDIMKNMKTKK